MTETLKATRLADLIDILVALRVDLCKDGITSLPSCGPLERGTG